MKELTLGQIAAWCGAKTPDGAQALTIRGVGSDSRAIAPGYLFIALKGEHADGHDYIAAAEKNGAVAAIVEHPVETALPCLVVDDAVRAYGSIAAGYRQLLGIKVIGITGSVGKTTTKEMTACVLEGSFETARTEGNQNNHLGLPMSIMRISERTQVAVLEMGMNHFGEVEYLTGIAKPDVAVITNIGTAHIEYLGSREGILKAKLEIMQGVPGSGFGVFNGDEPLLWDVRHDGKHKKYYFGIENPACDVIASDVQEYEDGMRFMVHGLGHLFELFVPTVGHHSVYNALAATTAALLLGVKPEQIQARLAAFLSLIHISEPTRH